VWLAKTVIANTIFMHSSPCYIARASVLSHMLFWSHQILLRHPPVVALMRLIQCLFKLCWLSLVHSTR